MIAPALLSVLSIVWDIWSLLYFSENFRIVFSSPEKSTWNLDGDYIEPMGCF